VTVDLLPLPPCAHDRRSMSCTASPTPATLRQRATSPRCGSISFSPCAVAMGPARVHTARCEYTLARTCTHANANTLTLATQMIWKETERVGCAVATSNCWQGQVHVCHYRPVRTLHCCHPCPGAFQAQRHPPSSAFDAHTYWLALPDQLEAGNARAHAP